MSSTGIRCPRCGGCQSKVIKVWRCDGYISRRHRCQTPSCQRAICQVHGRTYRGVRWTTLEFFSERAGVVNIPQDIRPIRVSHPYR